MTQKFELHPKQIVKKSCERTAFNVKGHTVGSCPAESKVRLSYIFAMYNLNSTM